MIQLKIRSEYTLGKTYAPISLIIEKLIAQGCTAAGLVDIDGTWGHVPFHNACRKAGIKPMLGVDLCVQMIDDSFTRMWFLARNPDGLKELYGFTSKAFKQSQKFDRSGTKPVLYDFDVLEMSSNIMRFSGSCLDADFLRKCNAVVDINPSSHVVNAQKLTIAKRSRCSIVETSDNDYVFECPDNSIAYELATGSSHKYTPQFILDELSHQDVARLLADTIDDYSLPQSPMVRCEGDLEGLCRQGIEIRNLNWNDVYETRLRYELDLIRSKDFESYFLIVADMVHFAKQHMLVGPSRGSAAGSLVCYLSRITEIDPTQAGLFFERFIDVTRTDLPDIDLDFPDNKRHIVFDYMSEKYGADHVAHIGTISQFKPRSALMKACKALDIPYSATGAVKADMIVRQKADVRYNFCLKDTFERTKSGQNFIAIYPHAKYAAMLEGHASHTGVHAAGLLVSTEPLTNFCTVTREGIAQIDKHSAETLGLLKIDVLGLRTLSILEDSGVDIDWYNLPLDDQATYDVLNAQRLSNIFQFDGRAMRNVSRQVHFDNIEDIDAVTALARPGPLDSGVAEKYIKRKRGAQYMPLHPLVDQHMSKTYGLPIYQEQTLAIVREIGQFGWEDTTAIRKAISKSFGGEFFETYYEKFKDGAMSQGLTEDEARTVWELINAMGSWQMNKAHTYSYAVLSYWTAYLKAHHPVEFAAANLRSAKDEESAIRLLREIDAEGIKYVPFDINKSRANWSAHGGVLYGGFTALKGIAEITANKYVAARDAGLFTQNQLSKIMNAYNPFSDIYPIRTRFQHYYDAPNENGIGCSVSFIKDLEDIPHKQQRVFIARILYINKRNVNDEENIQKRGGLLEKESLEYIDIRFEDDTGQIGGRLSKFDYPRDGQRLLCVPIGSYVLIRASFFNGIRYAFVNKWKILE